MEASGLARIESAVGRPLELARVRDDRRAHELRGESEVFGRLRKERALSETAEAVTADGSWRFVRRGFFRRTMEATHTVTGERVAGFRSGWTGGGTLEVAGRAYRFARDGWWGRRWTVAGDEGELIRLRALGGLRRPGLELDSLAQSLPQLSLIVLSACYLALAAQRDDAAAASVSAVGAGA